MEEDQRTWSCSLFSIIDVHWCQRTCLGCHQPCSVVDVGDMEINNLVTVLHQKTAHKFMLMFETLEQQILQQESEDEERNYCSNVEMWYVPIPTTALSAWHQWHKVKKLMLLNWQHLFHISEEIDEFPFLNDIWQTISVITNDTHHTCQWSLSDRIL